MEQEAHHSILHFLFRIEFIKNWIPQTDKQPDLILNTYFMILLLTVLIIWVTRRLERLPEGRIQNFLETIIEWITGFFGDIVGERGRKYVPFVGSFFIFILALNLFGIVPGFQSPTADLNTTLGMALVSILGVQFIAIKELGLPGYIKHFVGEPVWLGPLMVPLHAIGELARVMSLSIRLFGNIFGEDTIIIILAGLSPIFLIGHQEIPYLPIQLPMLLFALFTSFIQAMIFSVLTSIYITTFLEEH